MSHEEDLQLVRDLIAPRQTISNRISSDNTPKWAIVVMAFAVAAIVVMYVKTDSRALSQMPKSARQSTSDPWTWSECQSFGPRSQHWNNTVSSTLTGSTNWRKRSDPRR
jgi:hypothetical protein